MKIILTSDNHYGYTHSTDSILRRFYTGLNTEAKKEGINIVVHVGDWAITKQKQIKSHFKLIRECCPDLIILGVLGNHDFWTRDYEGSNFFNPHISYEDLVKQQKTWAQEFNITMLDAESFVYEDVIFCGFDGWYGHYNPPTNDRANMYFSTKDKREPFETLHKKAAKDFEKILDIDTTNYSKSILLTHFPWFTENQLYKDFCANKQMEPFIIDKFDIALVGHSHKLVQGQIFSNGNKKCLAYNAGSDYNKPRYQIIEV